MLKILYIIIIFCSAIFLLVFYFTNVLFLNTKDLVLLTKDNRISIWLWLLILIVVSFILGFFTYWLTQKLVYKKPKDFDEFDI